MEGFLDTNPVYSDHVSPSAPSAPEYCTFSEQFERTRSLTKACSYDSKKTDTPAYVKREQTLPLKSPCMPLYNRPVFKTKENPVIVPGFEIQPNFNS